MSPQNDTLDLIVNNNTVTLVLQWLEAIGNREHWPAAVKFPLTIGVDEALTNIVSYAFKTSYFFEGDHRTKKLSTPHVISLKCLIRSSQIKIEIIDNGRPYDPTTAVAKPQPSSIENASIGGIGLRLMRHYLSDISYARMGNHNCLTLSVNTGFANAP